MPTNIVNDSKICKAYQKLLPRAVNDIHSLDKNIFCFDEVNELSCYSKATIIKSKQTSTIMKNFIQS